MASVVRSHRWADTPLGPMEHWPEPLLCAVDTILESRIPMAVCWGPEMIQIYNDAYLELIGDQHPRALGAPAAETWSAVWPALGPRFRAVLERGEATGQENVLIPTMRGGRIEEVFWTYSASPLYGSSGEVEGILSVCLDVTAQRRTETDAEESAARLDAIYNTSVEYIGLLSIEGKVLDSNRASLEFANNTREELLGRNFWECPWWIYTPGAPEMLRRAIARAAGGEAVRYEVKLARPKGDPIIFDFSLTPVRNARGEVVYLVPESRDITWVKRAELALKETEKLATVGRLAASIAHEINNPLEAVTNLLYLALQSGHMDELHGYLHMAERELQRASTISTETLRFNRQSSKPRVVDCAELVESALFIHHGRLASSRIEVAQRLQARRPLNCFDGEIRQVLNNLVANAIDAMHEGGRLLVRSREATHWPTRRKGLMLTVADTGAGIRPEHRRKIFEPFFTTKGTSGTGLGLWVSQEIARRHQGQLRVRSSQGRGKNGGRRGGTVFTLFLPFEAALQQSAA
jgi:PAS domain S-box-containing protein